MSSRSLRGTINAAEIATDEKDWEIAEAALLEALGRVRKNKNKRGGRSDQ